MYQPWIDIPRSPNSTGISAFIKNTHFPKAILL